MHPHHVPVSGEGLMPEAPGGGVVSRFITLSTCFLTKFLLLASVWVEVRGLRPRAGDEDSAAANRLLCV